MIRAAKGVCGIELLSVEWLQLDGEGRILMVRTTLLLVLETHGEPVMNQVCVNERA